MPATSDQFYRLVEAANLKKEIAALMGEGVTKEEVAKMLRQCIAELSDSVPRLPDTEPVPFLAGWVLPRSLAPTPVSSLCYMVALPLAVVTVFLPLGLIIADLLCKTDA
jgi:hypothetical protein